MSIVLGFTIWAISSIISMIKSTPSEIMGRIPFSLVPPSRLFKWIRLLLGKVAPRNSQLRRASIAMLMYERSRELTEDQEEQVLKLFSQINLPKKKLSDLNETDEKTVLDIAGILGLRDEKQLSEEDKELSFLLLVIVIIIYKLIFERFERAYRLMIDKWIINTLPFWIGSILLLFFLTSISASALLAEYDARRGARLLSGNWSPPMVTIFSDKALSALESYKRETQETGASDFQYGPFGLLTSNETTLYLTDWKKDDFYNAQPQLYLVPRMPEQSLIIFYPTPTSTPTYTPMPTPTSTATPIPTATATPSIQTPGAD